MRPCGPCRLCCKIFPLPVLDKPEGVWCRHVTAAGCAIHETTIPVVCRQYDCYWREGAEMADGLRPDLCGLVVSERGMITVGGVELAVFVCHEAEPGASRSAARAFLDRLVSTGRVAMVIHGAGMELNYDRSRYWHITPLDIEAAMRYEQSQDADTLRQIGAVDAEYRPLSRDEAERLVRSATSEKTSERGTAEERR